MTLDVFNSVVQGYNDRIIDMQALTAQIGYWSAYYQSKRPSKINKIVQNIMGNKFKKSKGPTITQEADVAKFEEREARRMATYNRWRNQDA